MKNIKTILAAALVVCMLLSLAPFAFADNYINGAEEDSSENITGTPAPADAAVALADDASAESGVAPDYEAMFAGKSWDDVIADFLARYSGFSEIGVMLGYYNTVTGEEYYHNPDIYCDAASTYKVPLNMLFAEKIAAGEESLDSMIGAYKYSEILHRTIVDSNNELANVLWAYFGSYNNYRHAIAEYASDDPESLDYKFYVNNYITARQALTILKTLYENEERFPNIIDTMKEAEPEKYFRAEEKRFEIAHKYGYNSEDYHFYLNDTGIIYTDEPIIIVFYSDNVSVALDMMAKYCTLMCDYTQYHSALRAAEAEAKAAEEAARLEAEAKAAEEAARAAEEEAKAAETAPVKSTFADLVDKEGKMPEITFSTFILGVMSLAVGLIVLILVISAHRKVGMFWGFICAVLITCTLLVVILGNTVGMLVSGGTEGDPAESVTGFFDAITLGNYPAAYDYLNGYTTLGLENTPDSEAAAMIQKALEQSYSYQLESDMRVDGISAEQDVLFTYLDLSAVDARVQALTPDKLEELVAANPLSKVYDENNEYRPEITQKAYLNALKEVLADAESCYTSESVRITVDYVDKTWLITPDQTLLKALLGGLAY